MLRRPWCLFNLNQQPTRGRACSKDTSQLWDPTTQPPNQPTNTHLMLTCLRRDQKVPHWDSTTMEPLQQNSDEQHSGLSHVGHLRPSSDASHAEKAAAVGDKQTGCAGKNDVMSDRGLPWRDLRGALFDALPESWLPLSLPSSS